MKLSAAIQTQNAQGESYLLPDGTIDWSMVAESGVKAYDSETLNKNLTPVLIGLALLWLVAG